MIIRPITFLLSFGFRTMIRHSNLPMSFVSLFTMLFTASSVLYKTVGILPTLNILNNIRLALINPDRAMRGLEVILRQSTRITATQLTNLIKGLTPFVEDCLKYPRVVNRLFYIFNIFLTLFSFGPIIRWLAKTLLGLVFTSLGVLWNESLSSITLLKDAAIYIIDNFESISGIKVPSNDLQNISSVGSETMDSEKTSYLFTITGLILLGFVVPLAALCITQHYCPEVVDSIPYGNTIVNTVYDIWNSFTGYFRTPSGTDSGAAGNINLPEAISRNSSGGSDRTIRMTDFRNPITPQMDLTII